MTFTPLAHTAYPWHDLPAEDTPLDKTHLEAAEDDLITYAQTLATQLNAYIAAQRGAANGFGSLDGSGKQALAEVPASTVVVPTSGTVGNVPQDNGAGGYTWGAVTGGGGIKVYDVTKAPYSADSTGATKCHTAIQAAIDAAFTAGGGTVYLPTGQYLIGATLTLYDTVRLLGDGPNSGPWPQITGNEGTRINASSDFPAMCPMVAQGKRAFAALSQDVVFSCQVERLTVDCLYYAMVGIYSNKVQEHSRLDYVTVQKPTQIGIHWATPNGSPGANQSNNCGMGNIKVQPPRYNTYTVTTLNGAVAVEAAITNPIDANSNYTHPVTTAGQASGTVLVTDTTGWPTSGAFIISQASQQAPVFVFYTGLPSAGVVTGCLTDASPTQTPALNITSSAKVETPAAGIYIQNVGAMRGIDSATFDTGFASSVNVGLRLDGCNGVYAKIHAEHVKYGALVGSAAMTAGAEFDHWMLGGDTTVTSLIRVESQASTNSQHALSFRHIMNYVAGSGVHTIEDLANGNTINDQYVSEYVIGTSGVGLGGSNASRPIISSSPSVLSNFKKGLIVPLKAGGFTDADFVNPADGLIGIDNTGKVLYLRAGGVWYALDPAATAGLAPYYPWQINNLLGWAFDPIENNGGASLTAGQLMLTKIAVTPGVLLNNLIVYLSTAGSSLTTGQCFGSIYSPAGTLIGTTADQAASWASVAGSTNLKIMALTEASSGSLTLGPTTRWVYGCLLANGTTPPIVATAAGSTQNTMVNAGLAGGANGFRGGTILTGQTSLPGSIVLGNVSNVGNARWLAVD